MSTVVKLKSTDGEVFDVDIEITKCMGIVSRNGGDGVVEVPEVTSSTLRLVIQWAEHHKNDPIPDASYESPAITELSQWDVDFFNVDRQTLLDLALASHHMDIKALSNGVCTKFAKSIKDKLTEEFRTMFNSTDVDRQEDE